MLIRYRIANVIKKKTITAFFKDIKYNSTNIGAPARI